jgi:hypothetical protein
MKRPWRDLAAACLLVLGCSQMVGDLCGCRALKGLGAASAFAPCPKVFCDVNGLEGFASDFTLELKTQTGAVRTIAITPEIYSRLKGPYNRRNAYGAVLSFAPKLPPSLWRPVYNYGWRRNGPLRRELGVPDDVESVALLVGTRTRGRHDAWKLSVEDAP